MVLQVRDGAPYGSGFALAPKSRKDEEAVEEEEVEDEDEDEDDEDEDDLDDEDDDDYEDDDFEEEDEVVHAGSTPRKKPCFQR